MFENKTGNIKTTKRLVFLITHLVVGHTLKLQAEKHNKQTLKNNNITFSRKLLVVFGTWVAVRLRVRLQLAPVAPELLAL